jgi:hypothetical protein
MTTFDSATSRAEADLAHGVVLFDRLWRVFRRQQGDEITEVTH